MTSDLRVVYVPRRDYIKAPGGDYFLFRHMIEHIRPMGVEIEVVPVEKLAEHKGADFLHLSQIYQLDAAEFALNWAQERGMPVLINPLFEDMLPVNYRQAIKSQQKWRALARIAGFSLGQVLYTRWQMARRSSTQTWQRKRELLLRSQIVTNTQYEYDHVTSYFKIGGHPGSLVRVGIDSAFYRSWLPDGGGFLPAEISALAGRYILQVGVISARKNQDGLLQALMQTRDPIVFLGRSSPYEGDYSRALRKMAQERGNVHFLEWVSEEALLSLYGNALVHILPSWSERPGMVTLEAAACGCRVISSNRAPIQEYIGDRAYYIDPFEPQCFRSIIDRASINEPAQDLREYVLSHFGWEHTARQMKSVYLKLES